MYGIRHLWSSLAHLLGIMREIQHHLLPGSDLRVVIYSGHVSHPSRRSSDVGRFRYQKGAGHARPLFVVLYGQVGVNVLLVRAEASKRRKNDSVLELHVANLDRPKERGRREQGHFPCVLSG